MTFKNQAAYSVVFSLQIKVTSKSIVEAEGMVTEENK